MLVGFHSRETGEKVVCKARAETHSLHIKLLRDLDPDHVLTFNRSVMCQASSPGNASLTVVYSRNDLHLVESSWESVSATLIKP